MSASARLSQVAGQLAQPSIHTKSPSDVVIVSALRTPLTRAKKGGLRDLHAEDLLAAVLKATIERTRLDPKLVQDIQVGNVLPSGGGATVARMAALYAGLPDTTAVATVNRQCSSGLQAVATIAHEIQAGQIDIGIGAGVECMTRDYGPQGMPQSTSDKVTAFQPAADCLLPVGITTSENIATKFNVSRAKQDAFAAASHRKAARAQQEGLFKDEIVPIEVTVDGKAVTLTNDDGVRPDTTDESLARLKPAFSKSGTTTAGNASQVTDGAAAVMLMRRSVAEKLKMPILGRFVNFAAVGVPPYLTGIGPIVAIPEVLRKAGGVEMDQIDILEINEAFASQTVYCVEHLGIPMEKVNPKGGAIALGHPLGCTGARQIATILPELKRQNKRIGVVSMCCAGGMGAAAIVVRE
ncbi:3-ketoacyl-CoA thiolase with broad chain length specificity [Sorochytrium milnesiophthora]